MERSLLNASPAQIASDERLRSYHCILRSLSERQRWICFIQPMIERSQAATLKETGYSIVPTYIRNMPREVWEHIIHFVTPNHLRDSFEKEARLLLHSTVDSLPSDALRAVFTLLVSKGFSKK